MNKMIGGVLLIAGTTIGAGMLGLPVVTTFAGFWPSIVLFIFCWGLMLMTAFFFLDVNLHLGKGCNLVSMADKTLGSGAKVVTWVIYLLLLYSLAAAYISGSAPFLHQLLSSFSGHPVPLWCASLLLPLFSGACIYRGTLRVDYINRILMIGLALSYFSLAVCIPAHCHFDYLRHHDAPALLITVTILFTSFGYHIIMPSLITYIGPDRSLLRKSIIIGSAIPLFIYILWQLLIQATVPSADLILAWKQGEPATVPLAKLLDMPLIAFSARLFSFFAIITSFLGVMLSLFDFLADGLQIEKTRKGKILSLLLSFAPPLFFVFFYEKGFYFALKYAGACVAAILGILPACMAWTLKEPQYQFYRSWKGRLLLASIIFLSSCVIVIDLFGGRKFTEQYIAKYISVHVS